MICLFELIDPWFWVSVVMFRLRLFWEFIVPVEELVRLFEFMLITPLLLVESVAMISPLFVMVLSVFRWVFCAMIFVLFVILEFMVISPDVETL